MTPIRFVILLTCSAFEVFGGVAGFEIAVTDRAMVQRCVTSNDARNIAVGMPGGFNYTFDPVRCRLDAVWFGAFLDYRNEATGRGGGKVQILGAKQSVGSEEVPLRVGDAEREPKAIEFEGYRKEPATGTPTFLFRVDDVAIEQRVLSFGDDQVLIELLFPDKNHPRCYYKTDPLAVTSIELSENLQLLDRGVIHIPAGEQWAQIRIRLKPSQQPFVRQRPITDGQRLYALYCMSCHTLDGSKRIGPSFVELWAQERKVIRDGVSQTVQTDEHYIRESILQPQAAIVQGYENASPMVEYREILSSEQIDSIVNFLMEQKPREREALHKLESTP